MPTPRRASSPRTARSCAGPRGGVHRAGTETSTYGNGSTDGAVRSGERVAKEILAAL
ncbi:FAD-dependent oxidoreductase [Streptomyces sp. NPDC005244]|uniref:FAD-dependent oxidoreductase n=1 Tax=Streptomyces sp. NPDC005244 TaxID=3364708 RepID=UPI00369140A2